MDTATVTFHIPQDVRQGLVAGEYRLFGGTVRDEDGRIVRMLKPVVEAEDETSKRDSNGALVGVLIAGTVVAIIGGGILVYRKLSRRGRLQKPLKLVGEKAREVFASETVQVERQELLAIKNLLSEFLALQGNVKFRSVELRVSPEQLDGLRSLAQILTELSNQIKNEAGIAEAPPQSDTSDNLVDLVQYMKRQIDYQNRNWPGTVSSA